MAGKFSAALLVGAMLLLGGCGGAAVRESDPGVQDIQPGDASVIQAPAPSSPAAPSGRVEERNI